MAATALPRSDLARLAGFLAEASGADRVEITAMTLLPGQTIRPPRPDLGFLPCPGERSPAAQIAGFRAYLDHHPQPRPVLEWAIRWLATHIPPPLPPVLCHRDFRTGNYMVDGTRLTGILDWE